MYVAKKIGKMVRVITVWISLPHLIVDGKMPARESMELAQTAQQTVPSDPVVLGPCPNTTLLAQCLFFFF